MIFKNKYHIYNIKMSIRVKMMCHWTDSKSLCNSFNHMSKGDYTWNNIHIVYEGEYDYIVIINSPRYNNEWSFDDSRRTIIFRMEPNMRQRINIWGYWSNPDINIFLKVCYHETDYNNLEWHLSKTYTELMNNIIVKTENNILSTILSNKYNDPGHKLRVDFVKFLENNNVNVHVYGNNFFNYVNYKGSLQYKDAGLFPYKYTFNAENNSIHNYFTEKIIDAILSECLCFYWGCENISEYIDERAYVRLDLNNMEESYNIVVKAMEEDWWSQRIDVIRREKYNILNNLAFFPRLARILEEHITKH